MNDVLSQLRLLFYGFCSAVAAMAFVVVILVSSAGFGDGSGDGVILGVGIALAVGVATLVAERVVHRRPLDGSSPGALVASFRTRWMVEVALAETPVLAGFALFLVLDRPEPFMVGLALTGLGFWSVAPTDGRLEAIDEELASQGSPLRLSEVLRSAGGAGGGPPGGLG